MKNESGRKPRILVAEDNEINLKVIGAVLNRHGYGHEIAFDGAEAIQKFGEGGFDLVLMDCQMPNVDGLKAASAIRKLEEIGKSGRCPMVALTANAMKGDRERCLAAGFDDFLAKPFKSADLINLIQSWSVSERRERQ